MGTGLSEQKNIIDTGTNTKSTTFPQAMNKVGRDKNILIPLVRKDSPTHLAESINSNNEGVGAFINVKEGSKIMYQTNKFTLQAFSFNLQERSQILNTFGSSSVSFFGDSARVYNFSGAAVDYRSTRTGREHEYFHGSSLIKMYNDVLRGTQLVKNNQIAYITIGNHQVEGYPLSFSSTYSSNSDKIVTFNMSWLVTNHSLSNGAPDVVSERDLQNMYIPSVDLDKVTAQYIKKIDSILDPVENFLVLSKYTDKVKGGQEIIEFINFGTDYFLMVDDMFKKIDPNIDIVREMKERAVVCKDAILNFYDNPDSYLSPILGSMWVSKERVEESFTGILSGIESISTDKVSDVIYELGDGIRLLGTLPNKLYSVKAQHLTQ